MNYFLLHEPIEITMPSEIVSNIELVKQEIEHACLQSQRDPASVGLICVSKHQTPEKILEAYQSGERIFGENRVQEYLNKAQELPHDIEWHFIGTLQKNKVNKIIGKVSLIHSVDSFELADKISQSSYQQGILSNILIQVNTSHEISKHGHTVDQWKSIWPRLLSLKGIVIKGLMTIGPLTSNDQQVKQSFSDLKTFLDWLNQTYYLENPLKELSMGMSSDFKLAISFGATWVRVGSKIF